MRRRRALIGALALAAGATVAQADFIRYTITLDEDYNNPGVYAPGNVFNVKAEVVTDGTIGPTGSLGLAAFAVSVTNAVSMQNVAPLAAFAGSPDNSWAGFTVARTAGTNSTGTMWIVGGGQDVFPTYGAGPSFTGSSSSFYSGDPVVTGFGQTNGSLASVLPGGFSMSNSTQAVYPAFLPVASGTYGGQTPGIVPSAVSGAGQDTAGNLLLSASGSNISTLQANTYSSGSNTLTAPGNTVQTAVGTLQNQWKAGATGNWETAGDWTTGLPDGAAARFLREESGGAAVNMASNHTVTSVYMQNNSGSYTVSGAGTLTVDNGASPAVVQFNAGNTKNHSILTPVFLKSDTTVSTGSNTLTVGALSTDPSKTLTVNGNLTVAQTASARQTNNDVIVEVGGLSFGSSSIMDVTNHDMIIHYPAGQGATTLANVQNWILNGYNSPITTTPAIKSSNALASGDTFLAAFDNNDVQVSDWYGHTLSNFNEIIVKYTYFGDLDLTGSVDANDYLSIDSNFGTGTSWLTGDADLSGVVDANDYLVIDSNFGKGTVTPLVVGINAVPEPSLLGLIGGGMVMLAARRRRRS